LAAARRLERKSNQVEEEGFLRNVFIDGFDVMQRVYFGVHISDKT
jgi:hypothetical protein